MRRASIVRQIRWLTLALGFFLLLEAAGTYFFSRSHLQDLARLQKINQITDVAARATDNVNQMREILEKTSYEKSLYPREYVPLFEESYRHALQAIDQAITFDTHSTQARELIRDARTSLVELGRHSRELFRSLPSSTAETEDHVRKELLIARQFALDTNESLRGVQITLTHAGNELFAGVYQARYTPFLVSLVIAIFLFGFSLYFGFTITRKLKRSLDNLLYATDEAGRGNLSLEIPVLSDDEIGTLTDAFKTMTANLEKSLQDVQNAVRIRDEFLSIASHELKTPITSLKMQLQFARRQIKVAENIIPPPERLARVFDTSVIQVDRLTNLVEDLLDVTRIETGKLSFNFERADLSGIVRGVLERFEDAIAASKCTARLTTPSPVVAWCDPFRIEQVFVNLISNAMKYSPGSPIDISVLENGSFARIEVRDYGMGIPAEKRDIIFNRFERIASKQNISGLGLGLYISKKVVDAHHGRIWVESEPGKGSRFILEIPTQPQGLFESTGALSDTPKFVNE